MNRPESETALYNGNSINPQPRALVIDKDRGILGMLSYNLPEQGFEFRGITDMEEGIAIMIDTRPEFVLAEEEGHGQVLDNRPNGTSVVVLQNRRPKFEAARMLDAGASHVEKKPLSPDVLASHMRAIGRRVHGREMIDTAVQVGDLNVDLSRRLVTLNGERIHLSRTEYQLVRLFAENKGRVMTSGEIVLKAWGRDFEEGRRADELQYLRMWVSRLRGKFNDREEEKIIQTFQGIGYGFGVGQTTER